MKSHVLCAGTLMTFIAKTVTLKRAKHWNQQTRDMMVKITGWKKKPCPFDPEKLHRWTTMEGKDENGNRISWTACKNCMMRP